MLTFNYVKASLGYTHRFIGLQKSIEVRNGKRYGKELHGTSGVKKLWHKKDGPNGRQFNLKPLHLF